MTEAAWETIPGERDDDFWALFDARYRFRPKMRENGTGIDEPPGSVTIDLSPIFAGQRSQFAAGEDALNALALLAMTEVFSADQRLLVLDWQHPSHWFWPHRQALHPKQEWPVEVFPNGDYYIFLTEDMTVGTFGHPWRQTLCIFGTALVESLVPKLAAWLSVKRRA
ncbi:DUF2716 domain-containing protein [Rugosimonospora africana]|uniref:DUF2716 domain-containing protein n=1 Tax=Rugosimonospora africana TaxID=556532 RepID=A0A8J3QQM2_9ACTN|nr:DUF2716 domain-containing protein [Rugosimonospora africana]GIH13386.1 hypothetical protein Raf01_15580 [Rugosimonospora africana]